MKLYSLAKKFEVKYFQKKAIKADDMRNTIVEHIQQSVANASTRPATSGIMPFVQMLTQDNARLSFTILKNGSDITIQSFSVNPLELSSKYQALVAQVKKYLEKNSELFPSKYNGDSVSYDNFTFTLNYGEEPGIAVK